MKDADGCGNGWYSINKLNEVDNAITNVEFKEHSVKREYGDDYSYNIFVFCEDTRIHLLDVTGDDGNGYYGTGYTIHVLEEIIDD